MAEGQTRRSSAAVHLTTAAPRDSPRAAEFKARFRRRVLCVGHPCSAGVAAVLVRRVAALILGSTLFFLIIARFYDWRWSVPMLRQTLIAARRPPATTGWTGSPTSSNIVIVTASNTYNPVIFLKHEYAREHDLPWHWCVPEPGVTSKVKRGCLKSAAQRFQYAKWLFWIDGDAAINPRLRDVPLSFFVREVPSNITWVASDSQDMNTGVFFLRNRRDGLSLLAKWQDAIDSGVFTWDDQHAMRSVIVDTIVSRRTGRNQTATEPYTTCGGPEWKSTECDALACRLLTPLLHGFRCKRSLSLISPASQTEPFLFRKTKPHLAPPYFHTKSTSDAFVWHPAGAKGAGFARFATRQKTKNFATLTDWYLKLGGEAKRKEVEVAALAEARAG
jgi:hypothetical protein